MLLYFGHRLDGQFVGSVIRNMAWAQGRETSGIKLETDAEGHPQLKSTNTTVAEGFAKPPTNFELGLGVPHPLNRAELLVVLATLRQQAEEVGATRRYDFSEIDTLPFSPAPICREASNSNRSRKHYELPIS